MSLDKFNKNLERFVEETDEGEASGSAGSQVEFKEFIGSTSARDDLLSPEERKHLLAIHQDIHAERVKKQKATIEFREQLKTGKISLTDFRQSGLNENFYKPNPILANEQQFSGSTDRQVNALPSENTADTNLEQKAELEYQYRLRYAPDNAPRFHPKPLYR